MNASSAVFCRVFSTPQPPVKRHLLPVIQDTLSTLSATHNKKQQHGGSRGAPQRGSQCHAFVNRPQHEMQQMQACIQKLQDSIPSLRGSEFTRRARLQYVHVHSFFVASQDAPTHPYRSKHFDDLPSGLQNFVLRRSPVRGTVPVHSGSSKHP